MGRKVKKTKFYRPGTLEVPGTKITLKTQPYTNGVIFNPEDPITSFHYYTALLKLVLDGYNKMLDISGLDQVIDRNSIVSGENIAKLKLLVNYLAESPIEISIKEQIITQDILAELELHQQLEDEHGN